MREGRDDEHERQEGYVSPPSPSHVPEPDEPDRSNDPPPDEDREE